MSELTFIGLDVHPRSVAAGLLDARTGEVRSCSAPARTAELVRWLQEQGEALSVAYEAGPTGFGLARACAAAQIPKAGNAHARRLLVEAAWHQRRPASGPGRELARRREGQPALVRVRAEAAGRRLQMRWRRFDARGKRSTVAAVAVARELAGCCWSLATMEA